MNRAPPPSSQWLIRAGAVALALAAMAPLRHDFPPITDFPEHAATIATLHDGWTGGPLAAWYETDFLRTQYWLMAVLGALLTPFAGGPVGALKLLLVLSSVGLVAALLRLANRFGGDERLVLVAIPLLWSRPFTLGFIPFVMAMPLVLLLFAEVGATEGPSLRRHLVLLLLGLAVFFLNLASVAWLLVGVVAVAVAREVTVATLRTAWRPVLRRTWSSLALVAPVLAWLAVSRVAQVDDARFRVDLRGRWWSPAHLLREAPEWLVDRWTTDVDAWLGWALLVAVGLCCLPLGERDRHPGRRALLALFVATASLTLALPFERGWLWGLSARFLPATVMLAPFGLSWWRHRVHQLGVVALLAVSLGAIVLVERQTVVAQDELSGARILEGLRPGSRLLQLSFDDTSAVSRDSVVSHVGAYHRVWNHGPNEPSFVDLPQSVVRYREGRAPWMRPWPWEFSPTEYDNAREGPHYDFVLTHGTGPSFPPPEGTAGPTWRLVATRGSFRLYERDETAR